MFKAINPKPGKEQVIKPIFSQRQSLVTRFVLLIILSLAILYFDHSYRALSQVRQWLTVAATPVLFLADLPGRIWGTASQVVMSHNDLLQENARLKARNLILEQKVQKLASLTAQNIRLRELLNSSELVDEQVLVAEVVGVDPDPFRHRVIINKGAIDKVYEGQAILDAHGVMGQVIEVSPVSSRVLMLTDVAARIPVQNHRTKYRAIATGTGRTDRLELQHIPVTEDFQEGDLLTSSGLGGIYPEGYPVGVVTRVIHNSGDAFASIEVKPLAEVNRSRVVLLVFREVSGLIEPINAAQTDVSKTKVEKKADEVRR
ncbi:rod shape-determining protein MreC [Endozoicomonas sp. ALE010]|uniref:rod shape-determining protein MreC n=1 Tax=Endozoicomonas sp. ALE010 TaxID=3403081 RepID=UPI003BB7CC36